MNPSPVIALNRAVAVAMSEGIEQGLILLENVGSLNKLDDYYLYHAAQADLLRRQGNWNDAINAYERALDLCQNETEINYLQRRIYEVKKQQEGD